MHTDVVIAGSGPTGLLLATELALAGVRPVVLDALPGPSAEPKANGLVGQVVRQLDMRGLHRRFFDEPHPPRPAPGWTFSGLPLDLVGLPDNPMFAQMITQPRLTELLDERARELGIEVRWGHALRDYAVGAAGHDGVTVEVTGPDGDYRLHAGWLVGADGGRSTVRKLAGIGFRGHTSATVARVAHVNLPDGLRTADGALDVPGFGRIPMGHNRYDTGMVIYFQPPGDDRQMLGTLEWGPVSTDATGELTYDELRRSLRRVLGVDVPFDAARGPGPHAMRRIEGQNSRQADAYRKGPVLLVGDAAHVHSAMGGPGLNLGLQDALNLGWKLAAVVDGWASAELLDTYQSERHPVGERVMLHSQAQIALTAPGPEVAALRTLLGEVLALPEAAALVARLLAGADVRYETGDLHRLSGYMVPDVALDDGRRLTALLHAARPVLLDLTGTLRVAVPDRVDVVAATMGDAPAAALLIRPDGYVAWAADTLDGSALAGLEAALRRWCGAQSSVARMQTVT